MPLHSFKHNQFTGIINHFIPNVTIDPLDSVEAAVSLLFAKQASVYRWGDINLIMQSTSK